MSDSRECRVAVFSTQKYDRLFLTQAATDSNVQFHFLEPRLEPDTVVLAQGANAICAFVNDRLDREVLTALKDAGIDLVALRCAGFNNVDLKAAEEIGVRVARVPAYSPNAVAEHAAALIMTLNRKTHRAFNRVREGNFLLDGLMGFDVNGCTVGIVGTGRIGRSFARIMQGFGCEIVAFDPYPDPEVEEMGIEYLPWEGFLNRSDIISLHCPLTPETHAMVDEKAISLMKPGVMLINTSRGAIVDTHAVIDGLKSGRIGSLGLDVYEQEENLFFKDLSEEVIQDDVFQRLLTFPNVLITGHQGFLTRQAMEEIARTTVENLSCLANDEPCLNRLI
ncbi:2-hydroxyacid dehydrogenase [Thioalkalivibrio paradoxus]|uniref:D-lactate dehydrogenase n=1 Tax=Thioalkalivibrio paradoxus ARh 1 TaxID=713585 RepID=W0DSD5_9GAMM|nr:2-hydroxyacid dehydrogenase [Thioalkalivibrio paradoxus]AHE99760.1 D-lactate dehydrogenase [Thioalkalivibrio paradoxus ARh 1]